LARISADARGEKNSAKDFSGAVTRCLERDAMAGNQVVPIERCTPEEREAWEREDAARRPQQTQSSWATKREAQEIVDLLFERDRKI
jgi:hypothetical protein